MFWPFFSTVTPQSGLGGGYGPGGTWGLVELIAVIAGPLFLLCLLLLVGVFLYQYHRRAYSHRQRLDVEDPSCDHLYPAKDRTLQDLIFDLSTSGSGSGERTFTLPLHIFKAALNHTSVLLSLRSRFASVCPADRGQNHRPAGNHRERSLWRGVARTLERRRRGGEDLFVQRGAVLVPRG